MTAPTTQAPPAGRTTGRGRRASVWILIGAGILIAAVLIAVFTPGQWSRRAPLDPESPAAGGTRALVQILEQHGVDVVVARDRQSALDALRAADATLALPDSPYLSDAAMITVVDSAADTVLVEPRARSLRIFFDDSTPAGFASGVLSPGCDLEVAQRAGSISEAALAMPGSAVTACYSEGDAAALLQTRHGSGTVSALDGASLLTNEHLAENGNAALAVGLLGAHRTLVWYLPTIEDTDLKGEPTLGSLTPPWVTPVIVLLLITGVVAGLWRGRRFGPLVAENLPVTVRVGETAEGRARLYARSHDPAHALEQLRHGTRSRLARVLGLGPAASPIEIADAVATRLGADRATVHGILNDIVPRSDRDLARLADELQHLEAATHAAARPGYQGRPGRSTDR